MGRFLLKRLGLALITLFLLSVIVFFGAQVLPGNVARRILGPVRRPGRRGRRSTRSSAPTGRSSRSTGTGSRASSSGDLGDSLALGVPVSELIGDALVNSLKLAALAFVIVVPLAILGGVIAALQRDRLTDRVITIGGLSLTVVPEFVTGIVLILVFGLWLDVLPGERATRPPGAGSSPSSKYLLLPALVARDPPLRLHRAHHARRARSRRSTPTTRGPPSSRACRGGPSSAATCCATRSCRRSRSSPRRPAT